MVDLSKHDSPGPLPFEEAIVAAYGSGEPVESIAARFRVSSAQIEAIVAGLTGTDLGNLNHRTPSLVNPQPPYLPAPAPPVAATSGMAVASLVLGIVGVVGGWCTFAIPCILATIFGYIGIGQTRNRARSGRGMAIAGLVLGLVPLGTIALILVFGGIGALLTPISAVSSKISDKPSKSTAHGNGPVVPLEAITINLADSHYLKLAISLQLAAGQSERLDTSEALNIAIETYTGRTFSELGTEQGREVAKQELLDRIKTRYDGVVVDVYFTQFVTQ